MSAAVISREAMPSQPPVHRVPPYLSLCHQDADNVIIIQRHGGKHYLDLRKNRFDGDLGVVPLEFERATGRLIEAPDQGAGLAKALEGGFEPRFYQQPLVREKSF